MNPSAPNSLKALWVLAVCAGLAAALPADAPAPSSVSADASVSLSPAAASPSAQTYAGFISGTVAALAAPLADFLAQSKSPGLSVAAGGFRELVTGERSPLCDHLDRDLNSALRDGTPYGVPSTLELQDAWISVGGNAADMSLPYTLRRFGRLLSVNAVVSGSYMIRGSSVLVTLRLQDCGSGSVLWAATREFPVSAVDRGDLNTYSGSAPAGYGLALSAPPPPFKPSKFSASPYGAGVTPPAGSLEPGPLAYGYTPPGVELESNVHETEFSMYRANAEAGYDYFDPLNSNFKTAVGEIMGPYVSLSWADIVHAEFFVWDKASLPASLPVPISNLFGYGMTTSLTLPVRLGHYWVLYGGLGGRFEAINVSLPSVPAVDTVSFGNNSFFGTVGAKIHRGGVGVDLNVAYDFIATYSPYLMAHLGLYYEYSFE